MDSGPAIREIHLQPERWYGQTEVSDEFLTGCESREVVDRVKDRMLLELHKEVMTHKVADSRYEASIPVPASWWQHLKHQSRSTRWLGWLSRLSPPKYEKRTAVFSFTKKLRFPEATIRFPQSLGPYVVAEQADVSWRPS